LPFADRWELLSIYPACDYVAIPSFYDGMPNVLLEAGALGVPVVASTAGGMVDVLEDGFSGFLFHPGDKHGCRNALWRVCNTEPSARKLMGDNLQKRIRNDFHSRLETAAYRKIMQ
jgi:glycosyltransferase involved in cell wall biosynthesis